MEKICWKNIRDEDCEVWKRQSDAKLPKQITIVNLDGSNYYNLAEQVYLLSSIHAYCSEYFTVFYPPNDIV